MSHPADGRQGACIRISRLAPVLVFLAVVAVLVARIISLNAGHFTYTLDDPYIHLALAENLVRGHYGLNLGEPSAPASSIAWPFLLLPFMAAGAGMWGPLTLNVLCSVAVLAVFAKTLRLIFVSMPASRFGMVGGIGVLFLMLYTNVIGRFPQVST